MLHPRSEVPVARASLLVVALANLIKRRPAAQFKLKPTVKGTQHAPTDRS